MTDGALLTDDGSPDNRPDGHFDNHSDGHSGRHKLLLRFVGLAALYSFDFYILNVAIYFVLRVVNNDEGMFYLYLMTSLLHWVLLLAAPLLVLLLIVRQWRRAGAAVVVLLVFALLFGQRFVPNKSQAAPPDAPTLRVMTFNMANCAVAEDEFLDTVRAADADIIGLQEVSDAHAFALAGLLLDDYPYRALYGLGIPGKGLLSRYPITEEELREPLGEGIPHIDAHVDVDGRPLHLMVAHPEWAGHTRIEQGARVQRAITESIQPDEAAILMGDFNITDQHKNYQIMVKAGLTDTFREVGWGFGATFPSSYPTWPLVRIDYIWATPALLPLNSAVMPASCSDHRPLTAEFAWPLDN